MYNRFLILFAFSFFLSPCKALVKEEAMGEQRSFEWVFGDLVKLDPEMVAKVISSEAGKRHYVDRNEDNKPEEVWFIDTSPRHTKENSPILVRVIDENGNLEMNGEPDQCGDLYIVDWHADGIVDVVLGYEDLDNDQDVDRMGLYFYDKVYGLRVWWSRDDGDDNLLWYDVDYTYFQPLCENKTHFGGDESFVSLYIKPGDKQWTPFFENPFFFYDRDGDGITEEVIRVVGNDYIQSLRWSMDADNDATLDSPRDYDVSISCCAPGWTFDEKGKTNYTLSVDSVIGEKLSIRGIPTKLILNRYSTPSFLQKQTWSRVLFTWDENDLNIAYNNPESQKERWEGVIASGVEEPEFMMPRIGWPDCGPFNKRYELCLTPKVPNEYYFNPSDRRIHLKYTDKTWLKVDYNYDNKIDMFYLWSDTDRDGIVDNLEMDTDGDGTIDDSFRIDVSQIEPVKWDFNTVNALYSPVIVNEPTIVFDLNQALNKALNHLDCEMNQEPVWKMINNRMEVENLNKCISKRLINSDETVLYYLRLLADQRISSLKKGYKNKTFWKQFEKERSCGNLRKMTQLLQWEFGEVTGEDYISWINSLRNEPEKKKVAWNNTWLPPNWGWESEKAAFRCYDGHFDLFGKRKDALLYPTIDNASSYHLDDGGTGMDILHVGKTGGCGGLVLYVDGISYPVRNEKGIDDPIFQARLFEETDTCVTIEFKVTGVGPKDSPYTIYIRPSALAGRYDSPVEVEIEGGDSQRKIQLGLVLNVLPIEKFFFDKDNGIMGLWGFQEVGIGWIGTGVIFDPDKFLYMDEHPDEHRVVLQCEKGKVFKYNIQGDWLRGHRFGPTSGEKDWLQTLRNTANSIKRE